MTWGESVSAELDGRGRGKFPALPDDKAFGKVGARKPVGCEDSLIGRPAVDLDMGEASREQGFRLNGCR